MTTRISKKHQEDAIIRTANEYKSLLCDVIRSGKNLSQDGMLYDHTATYTKYWKKSSNEALSPEERKIYRVNFCLASIGKEYAEIIWNEFFFSEYRREWMRKYNRSTYYRVRSRAIDDFYELIKE